LVTVLELPTLELSVRGLVAGLSLVGSDGNSSADAGSNTKRSFGLFLFVEDLGTEPLSFIATVLHALECMDWMEWSSSSNPGAADSLLGRRGRGRSMDGAEGDWWAGRICKFS
jgi:hypothetical protein